MSLERSGAFLSYALSELRIIATLISKYKLLHFIHVHSPKLFTEASKLIELRNKAPKSSATTCAASEEPLPEQRARKYGYQA